MNASRESQAAKATDATSSALLRINLILAVNKLFAPSILWSCLPCKPAALVLDVGGGEARTLKQRRADAVPRGRQRLGVPPVAGRR